MDKKKDTIITHIEQFIRGKAYFSSATLKKQLEQQGVAYRRATLNQQLYNLKTKQKLFDSGRGWYSTIARSLYINRC